MSLIDVWISINSLHYTSNSAECNLEHHSARVTYTEFVLRPYQATGCDDAFYVRFSRSDLCIHGCCFELIVYCS